MNHNALEKLEYQRICEEVKSRAMSYLGRARVDEMKPQNDLRRVEQLLAEVSEAVSILGMGASVPIPALDGIDLLMSRLDKGMALSESDVSAMAKALRGVQQLKRFMAKKADVAPVVAAYALGLNELTPLYEELERCVPNGWMADDASPGLDRARKKVRILEERVKKRLDATIGKYQAYLQDAAITDRGGRLVLPVKKEHRRLVPGEVVDQSASGQTLFVVPSDLAAIHEELAVAKAMEAMEVSLVLDVLTGLIAAEQTAIRLNLEMISHYDFLFAKAKYAKSIGGRRVQVNGRGRVRIRQGRHPLLKTSSVPLDFEIGQDFRVLIVTGPNTGGKTVALKTVGLLTLMVQSGLLPPVGPDSEFAVFANVLADIGDGQSIDQSLSTFSAHVKNVIEILNGVGNRVLVLMDELATGTDPGEGIGLSIAVLEALYQQGATVVATTHFNEIKQFASTTVGCQNARMEFDLETFEPLYRLRIGEAGNSYAFEIATKLGMPAEIIRRSREITGTQAGAGQVQPLPAASTPTAVPARSQPPEKAADRAAAAEEPAKRVFQVGDRVWIHSLKKSGIVHTLPDSRGQMVLLVQQRRLEINQKRVSPYLSREELYPEAYNLDIVLESKDTRKKRKIMNKRHVEGLTIDEDP